LLGNAIKHHDRPTGRIEASVQTVADHYQFQIADDGPGIPPQYRERVFGMFQTLRPRDEVEGSGIGLALVKKIVETYGGTVTLGTDRPDGRGTTVRFTWPRGIDPKEHTHER
jgi:signal transduction histidine kinase